ncbi:MAG: PqqD family protein [Syntrophobacteraceae bacterium]
MKRKDDMSLENVGGQDLLIPFGTRVLDMNGLVVLNRAGRHIWELLAEECSLEDLVSAVVDRFEVGADQAAADVRAFIDDLARQNWIEI